MATLDGPVTYPILDFVRMCGWLTFCGTLLIIIIGTLASELKLKYTKLQHRLRHLAVAHGLAKAHAAAQKAELVLLRLDNEQLTHALELLNKHATARKIHVVQLQLDNEQLKGLIRTLTLTNEDQDERLRHAEQKAAAIKTQNDGLAKKLMASRRQVFKLEQESREQKALLQRQIDIKMLVKENTNAVRYLDKPLNFQYVDSSGSGSEQGRDCITPSTQPSTHPSNISSTATSTTHVKKLKQFIHGILAGDGSVERTLASFLGWRAGARPRPRSRSLSATSGDTDTSLLSVDELDELERILRAPLYSIQDFALALALARKKLRSHFNVAHCGSEESRGFDSASFLGMSTGIACSREAFGMVD